MTLLFVYKGIDRSLVYSGYRINTQVIYRFALAQMECTIDVPRPLINDLWVFLFQKIVVECAK